MYYLGIDPGLKGGLAIINSSGNCIDTAIMPTVEGEIDAKELYNWISTSVSNIAILELVGARPGNGGCSMFSFGCGWGMVRGVLSSLGIRTILVRPQSWKKVVLKKRFTHDKAGSIRFCQEKWPDVNLVQMGCRVPHDGIADALCIAEYGRTTN